MLVLSMELALCHPSGNLEFLDGSWVFRNLCILEYSDCFNF